MSCAGFQPPRNDMLRCEPVFAQSLTVTNDVNCRHSKDKDAMLPFRAVLAFPFRLITARPVCVARTMPWQDVRLSVHPSVCLSVRPCLFVTRRYYI